MSVSHMFRDLFPVYGVKPGKQISSFWSFNWCKLP